ncbi:cyclin-like protein [Gorgonomyces haynaldii]|nr:cyclin-like protein [Gorgonomyces haynaldii]
MLPTPENSPTCLRTDPFDFQLEEDEYCTEIVDWMHQLENECLPVPAQMEAQPQVTWNMRRTLVLWLIEVHQEYALVQETLYLCVNLLDRMSSIVHFQRQEYQLLGITCLWVAAKIEENHGRVPSLKKLIYICCNSYRQKDFIHMERLILQKLGFRLSGPTSEAFLKAYMRLNWDMSPQHTLMSRYILEQSLVHRRFVGVKPSILAESAIWLAHEYLTGVACQNPQLQLYMTNLADCVQQSPRQLVRKYAINPFSFNQFARVPISPPKSLGRSIFVNQEWQDSKNQYSLSWSR